MAVDCDESLKDSLHLFVDLKGGCIWHILYMSAHTTCTSVQQHVFQWEFTVHVECSQLSCISTAKAWWVYSNAREGIRDSLIKFISYGRIKLWSNNLQIGYSNCSRCCASMGCQISWDFLFKVTVSSFVMSPSRSSIHQYSVQGMGKYRFRELQACQCLTHSLNKKAFQGGCTRL